MNDQAAGGVRGGFGSRDSLDSCRALAAAASKAPPALLYVLPKRDFFARGRRGRVTHAIGVANGLALNGVRVIVLSGPGVRAYGPQLGEGVQVEELVEPSGPGWLAALQARIAEILAENAALRHIITRYAVGNAARFRRLFHRFPDRRWVFEVNSLAYHQYGRVPMLLRRLMLGGERHVLRAADAIYVVSQTLECDLRSGRGGLDPSRIFVVPNAGDGSLARLGSTADRAATVQGGVRFVYLGMFQDYYDFAFVLKAFRRVVAERPSAELHFYGDGKRLESVRVLAEAVPNTRFHGRYDLMEMIQRGEIGRDWILLLPYRPVAIAGIGSPTKLFEYMALGRPVLASALGQLPDIVRDGETGSIYDPERVDDLVEKMRRLIDDPALRRRMGLAARDDLLRDHTWSTRMGVLWAQLRRLP